MSTQMAIEAAMVRKETWVNTLVTAAIAAVLSGIIFRGESSIVALSMPIGGILGIVPGTLNFTFLVTLALTLITRRRVRAGLYRRSEPVERSHLGAALPRNIILRGLSLAAVATLVLVPVGVALVWGTTHAGILPAAWSFTGMLAFYVTYFTGLSAVVTPIILWRALGD